MKNLYTALAAAVAAMPDPKKNAKNDHFKQKYADLGAVLECIEQPLRDNGLLLIQLPMTSGEGPVLHTRLVHMESAEELGFNYPLGADKPGPQAMGSAISYARRYTIKSMFGMVDVDDDAETAEGRGKSKFKQEAKPKPPQTDISTVEEACAQMANTLSMGTLRNQLAMFWGAFPGQTDREQLKAAYDAAKAKLDSPKDDLP